MLFSVAAHAAPVLSSAVFQLGALRTFVQQAHHVLREELSVPYEVELKTEPPPEEKKEDPPPEEPKEPPPSSPPPKAEKPVAAAPAAAKAGQVIAAKEDEPVDFTKFSMVQGSNGVYAGGVTASSGTSNQAVTDRNARPNGVVGGKGNVDGPGPADVSRAAAPASRDWNCSHLFPAEADANDINSALVSVVVTVRPDGAAQTVTVVNDPGHGFGRAARTCAMSQRYAPALDRAGQPTIGKTTPFTVRFTR